MIDNTTAVACINKFGSTKLALLQLTREIYAWALTRRIQLSAAHIPGVENVQADKESRTRNVDTEWQVDPRVFRNITEQFGTPSVDLFASRINAQVPKYVAWRPDPHATHIDAFTLNWKNIYGYAFPPFSLIGRTLQKLEREGATLIMVVPRWPTRGWYPRLMARLVGQPILLPQGCLHLPQQRNLAHPLAKKLRLLACKVSGKGLNL